MKSSRPIPWKCLLVLTVAIMVTGIQCRRPPKKISVETLLLEMVDLENLARRPEPPFKHAQASSFSRASHQGGDAWFDNHDAGQYVRTETNAGRTEQVLADLKGPGTVTRFWSANPTRTNIIRFYFDGEPEPRLQLPFEGLFSGTTAPFGPDFSYVSGTGGNLYYPLPYADSLKITIEEQDKPLRLYYEIGYRSYPDGTRVETFDPGAEGRWEAVRARVARTLSRPESSAPLKETEWVSWRTTISPGETWSLPEIRGEKAVTLFCARVLGTREDREWTDPERAHNAYRFLVMGVRFDGEPGIATPLGDFFGSGPGVNPYENLFFTVDQTGRMTSRLPMPFRESMQLSLQNAGRIPYTVEIALRVGRQAFTDRSYHLRAQWKTLSRESWPPFDTNLLDTEGEGKVIGTVYEIANDGLIWWGEGDQKVFIDGEAFPSTFGTGTEDDYGFAYGYNGPFVRPYHAQTRVDGPASGGHISLNRWYVLDVLPFRSALRFDQEIWHWMPCRPTWSQVIFWYAKPGSPGPADVDPGSLAPVDLGVRGNMLDPIEGEALKFETTGGKAGKERLANCSGAEHLVWREAQPGSRMTVHFTVLREARYAVELNLCRSPDYGRMEVFINGKKAGPVIDGFSPTLDWQRARLGLFDLREGDNILEVRTAGPNPEARPGNVFGLDYIFLVRQP
jgi:hypothetical protein